MKTAQASRQKMNFRLFFIEKLKRENKSNAFYRKYLKMSDFRGKSALMRSLIQLIGCTGRLKQKTWRWKVKNSLFEHLNRTTEEVGFSVEICNKDLVRVYPILHRGQPVEKS